MMPDCYFVAVIIHTNSILSGTIFETVTADFDISGDLNAVIDGTVAGGAITFLKTYDGQNGWDHSVHYSGLLNGEHNEITGSWTIHDVQGTFSGTFIMIRKRSTESKAALTESIALHVASVLSQ
jgi:hypothetical protein